MPDPQDPRPGLREAACCFTCRHSLLPEAMGDDLECLLHPESDGFGALVHPTSICDAHTPREREDGSDE